MTSHKTTAKVFFATHFEAFLSFATKEPAERIIDHHKNGWCGCAVGDYHREATSEPPQGHKDLTPNGAGSFDSPLLDELEKDHGFIFECLNNGSVPEVIREEHEIATYQGLARLMEAYKDIKYGWEFEDYDRG